MNYDKALVAGKLRRWEQYLKEYRLPRWEEIPDFGLYMEQVITLLQKYLDYLPPELKEEQFITAATINNYVRIKIMPKPVKRRYYRVQIAYLIIILTLKYAMSIALIQKLIPMGLSEQEVKEIYSAYVERHQLASKLFMDQIRLAAASILDHEEKTQYATDDPRDLVVLSAVAGGFGRLMAEKLLLLEGKTLENGGSISLKGARRDPLRD